MDFSQAKFVDIDGINTRYFDQGEGETIVLFHGGNFGSLDGDSAAAMRYTECRLARMSDEMLSEIDRRTVHFKPNYDGTKTEPAVLPARIPNLLINGVTGIAVGMATNVPPHHLGEVCQALLALLRETDHCWSKICSWYRLSRAGAPYDDMAPFAETLIEVRPDRLVWGSNWPHPNSPVSIPNDGFLLDQLMGWAGDDATRQKILVDNPARLFGFE